MKTTQNFGLSIYEPNDVTSYLSASGWNGTMEKIDSAMKSIQTEGSTNATDIATLESQMETAESNITMLNEEVTDLKTATSGNTSNINGINQSIASINQTLTVLNEDITDVADYAGKRFNGTLSANEETIAISIDNFTDDTLVDVYTSIYGINPLTIELRAASSGQPNLCVMTFEPQSVDMNVAVVTKGVNQKTGTQGGEK